MYLNTLKCTSNCTIKERQNNLCVTNYIPRKEDNMNMLDVMLKQVRYELFNNFDPSTVNGSPIQENNVKISITRKDKDSNDENEINL